jgi:tetratricopeptide (TPR) repeat protein
MLGAVALLWLAAPPDRATAADPAGKANALKKAGRYDAAASACAAAVAADARDDASRNALAWIQATSPDPAVRDGKAAVANATRVCEETDWKNPDYLDTLSAAYAETGDFEHAALWQGLAVELAHDASKTEFAARLELYNKQQAFREDPNALPAAEHSSPPESTYTSIDDCDAALARHPGDVRALGRRAHLWFEKKAYDKALADYSAALKLAPSNPAYLAERAAVYQAKGDTARARADQAAFHAARAMKHVADRQYPEAIADDDEAIRLAPESPRAYNQRAWLRATCPDTKFRDGKKAVADATRACDLTEYKNYQYIDTLAAACAESGDFDRAVTWESLAAELAPAGRKAMVLEHLELYKTGQPYRDGARP